ncbi:hypothetical protein [Nonomuraea maritima]|nr:hypothetical protein [Nonomuraea maritima]
MRVVYRGLAVAVAAAAGVAVTLSVVLPPEPDGTARPVAAPPTAALPSASAAAAGSVPSAASASASPVPSAASSSERPTPTPGTSLAPGYTAMEALYADPRVPRLTGKVRRMSLPAPGKRFIRDTRSGIAVPRLSRPWKAYGAAPFSTKQVLPPRRGTKLRGMFVTAPLPIMEQKSPRDTALLAARWTLNHHPQGSRITWLSSQPVAHGWALSYRVTYGGHSSRAAVVIMDGGMAKPGLAFITVPDSQRKYWRDIGRVAAGVRGLG